MEALLLLITPVFLDFLLGDPQGWPHPIIYIGKIIKTYENNIRKSMKNHLKLGGFILTGATLITVITFVTVSLNLLGQIHPSLETIASIYILYTALAAKCLKVETYGVLEDIKEGNLMEARKRLSYLVGRETNHLNMDEIIRATVETIAENTIDGVLAPLFYMALGILLGIPVQTALIYKTINTLDSMVGYIHEPYKEIGYASAKLDDILNYIPGRVGSLLMILAGWLLGYKGRDGLRILIRDRRNHSSPNCGYPESAVAGLLNIQLGGTNTYFGKTVFKPTIGDHVNKLSPRHISDSVKIMYGAEIIALIILIGLTGLI